MVCQSRLETAMSKEKLIIFDTTMRDGEQSPGAAMTKDEKAKKTPACSTQDSVAS